MKYLSIDCVVNAYLGFQDCMTNKSWGYLALMQACDKDISASVPYEINSSNVSNFLEQTFNLSEQKKLYDGAKTFFVFFSSRWEEFFLNEGNKLPNIYNVAVWAFRGRAFEDDVKEDVILNTFAREFHIPLDSLEKYFDTSIKSITFESSLYTESDLKTLLASKGVDVSKGKIDAEKKGIVAEPGQINRGPFTQPLYSGLDVTDYVLILQSNFYENYNRSFPCDENENILSTDDLVNKYMELVTSKYSTAGNAIFMASYGYAVMRHKLKAADIYNRATELYPEHSAKFRAQELNHAFKMYSYFLRYPELMHLPGIATNSATIIHGNIKYSSYRPYITAIKSKPFLLLAGISGTGKSRIVRELARACWNEGSEEYVEQKPRNFEMVQVKPNWHDSSELLGYVSRIGADKDGNGVTFVAGDFLKFIARAWEEQDVPYFLCLDEMNLAPVEQYFAEYLSVVESRKATAEGVVTDPILKKSAESWYYNLCSELTTDNALREQFLNEGICIPQNLIVIGTVNMDETTFSFSRKVLDRAMTIEMNEVDLEGGLTERYEKIGKLGNAELIGTVVEGVDVYTANKGVCDKVIAYLKVVNRKLEGTPFKIAYRTRNEFLLYVVNNLPYNKDEEGKDLAPDFVIARALDEITSMKILSRIEGDETKVSKLFSNDELMNTIKTALTDVYTEYDTETSISLAKLKEMKDKLESGYTSFWS